MKSVAKVSVIRALCMLCVLMALTSCERTTKYHVSINGNDSDSGTKAQPFRTISMAAKLAQPGDVITVGEGTYRERINPPRGGQSNTKRITYQAAEGQKVVIKGSEPVKDWQKVQNDTWKVIIPNGFFGNFNPYSDLIKGDWFDDNGREHHTGAVYLNGHWLTEAAKLDEAMEAIVETPLWFGKVDDNNTTIWAQFKDVNPNQADVEINVRQSVFYPEKPGLNYITVRGFTMSCAATPWSPPTAEQIGLIGTNWSKGWIIENNDISYSTCAGITLGKYGDKLDNTSANTPNGYIKTVERALENGWSKEKIGHHMVRNNHISHCEQGGVVGSLGAVFSTITGNEIHDIYTRQLFKGAEMSGIKIHAAIDVEISNNRIYRSGYWGIWLDWMAQGARVTGNLLYDNNLIENFSTDIFFEADHGPYLVDNNIFASPGSLRSLSEGGAYVHNLFAGTILLHPIVEHEVPFHKAHSTEFAGFENIKGGDDRFYNNIVIQPSGLDGCDKVTLPPQIAGNVYYNGAKPYSKETNFLEKAKFDPQVKVVEEGDSVFLHIKLDDSLNALDNPLVTTSLLGRAKVPNTAYENPDGTPLKIDTDYFGKKRSQANPSAGPFELDSSGKLILKVWPMDATNSD